jgi:hypothetical protein
MEALMQLSAHPEFYDGTNALILVRSTAHFGLSPPAGQLTLVPAAELEPAATGTCIAPEDTASAPSTLSRNSVIGDRISAETTFAYAHNAPITILSPRFPLKCFLFIATRKY